MYEHVHMGKAALTEAEEKALTALGELIEIEVCLVLALFQLCHKLCF
jgi:hypothetical protein